MERDASGPADGRMLMRAGVAGPPRSGRRAGGNPWAGWTVTVPCLLTWPVAGYGILVAYASAAMNCFDSCYDTGSVTAGAEAEFFVGLTAFVILIAGLAAPSWRRMLAGAGWLTFLAAWLCLLIFFYG